MGFVEDDLAAMFADWDAAMFNGTAIQVIYNDEFAAASVFGESVDVTAPECIARTVDVAGAVHGGQITIGTATWYIIGIEPHMDATTTLKLSSVQP